MASEEQQIAGSVASAPNPATSKAVTQPPPSRAAVGKIFQLRSEIPKVPTEIRQTYEHVELDEQSAGNFEFATEMLEEQFVGFWRERQDCTGQNTTVLFKPEELYAGFKDTLTRLFIRALHLKKDQTIDAVSDIATLNASVLAAGCCLTAYLKCRYVTASSNHALYDIKSLIRPRSKESIPIPTGFAFAIQQIGLVNVVDTQKEIIVAPAFPTTGHHNGVPSTKMRFNPNAYAESVEYARSLGVRFNMVDFGEKKGTAWWLLRPHLDEEIFELNCPIPPSNFTKSMALTYSMFLAGFNESDPSRSLVDLQPLGSTNYGTLMRNPHLGVNLSSYEAIADEANDVYSNV